jgi:hypothetical protein
VCGLSAGRNQNARGRLRPRAFSLESPTHETEQAEKVRGQPRRNTGEVSPQMDTDEHRWGRFPWHGRPAHVFRSKITETTEATKSTEKKGGANHSSCIHLVLSLIFLSVASLVSVTSAVGESEEHGRAAHATGNAPICVHLCPSVATLLPHFFATVFGPSRRIGFQHITQTLPLPHCHIRPSAGNRGHRGGR